MSPQIASSWVLVGSLVLCVALGALAVSSVSYSHLRTFKLAFPALLFGVVGATLMTTPKWDEIVFKWKDFETRITNLKQENRKIAAEKLAAVNQLAQKTNELTAMQATLASLTAERDAVKFTVQNAAEDLKSVSSKIQAVAPYDAKQELNAVIETLIVK
jgi:hypothetical protein